MNHFEVFPNQSIKIAEMRLSFDNAQLKLELMVEVNNIQHYLCFNNVSRLCAQNISAPMEIPSLEIIDNRASGWGRESTYLVRDFEDDMLSFYCESYD